jgi:TolB protein
VRDGDREIYVMNADGSGQTNLTKNPAFDSAPAWSPDGTRIAFISLRDGSRALFLMKADGTGATHITTNGLVGAEDGRLAWSPDGRRIAYEGYRDAVNQIFVVKVDRPGETEQLTADGVNVQPAWTWRRQ